jgi:hypothetical protein
MEKRKIILFLIPSIATFHPCNLAAKGNFVRGIASPEFS